MNIKLTLNGTENSTIKFKPYSLHLKKQVNELNKKYEKVLKIIGGLDIEDLKKLDLSDEEWSKLKDLQSGKGSSESQAINALLLFRSVPKLAELIKTPSEDDKIEYDIYKLDLLKVAIDRKSIPEGADKLFDEEPATSGFWQSLDLNEVEEAVKQFRSLRN